MKKSKLIKLNVDDPDDEAQAVTEPTVRPLAEQAEADDEEAIMALILSGAI